ncbi:MAG: IS1634 family transposase [Bacteroidetes bacterium]|nr:IS1634 family transposase [Bacteroidota bacterium]
MNLKDLHLHWGECKYKGKSYRTYSLARAYRLNGKNRKETVFKLGKLTDEEVIKWRSLLKAFKNPDAIVTTLDDINVIKHFSYLDVAAANAIWDYWQLDDVFQNNGKREIGISNIARILSINRCIDPMSKSQNPDWFASTALQWILEIDRNSINTSRIFRELEVIENHKEAICEHIFNLLNRRYPKSMHSVFYDLSSTTFSGSRCLLMKWGHCKEGYRNHVVLAIVVNKDGLPFYWEVLPGGTSDANTIVWLLDRLKKRFKSINTTLVFDRGMVSDDNLTLLEDKDNEIKYITAMDKSQIKGLTDVDFSKFKYFDLEDIEEQASKLTGFVKLNDDTFYQEIKIEGKRRYILCFNPQLFIDQRKARSQAVVNFRFFVKNLNAELLNAKKSRQHEATYKKFKQKITKFKLTSFVDVKLRKKNVSIEKEDKTEQKIQTYQGTVKIDSTDKQTAEELDGFWLLVTNHTERNGKTFNISAQHAINPYRDKVVIESAFRDIKSFVKVSPVCVWTEVHVKAHYTICVLSHLINRTLTLRLHENKGKITKGIVSHEKLYKNLSDCTVDHINIKNVGQSAYSLSIVTKEQKELLARIGLKNLISKNVTKKIKSLS